MNFTELYKKIAALDENLESSDKYTPKDTDDDMEETSSVSDIDQPLMGEEDPESNLGMLDKDEPVDECGSMMPGSMMSAPKQQDSVSMTVNMSGSGKGGIRDLLDVLKNIEHGSSGDKAMVIGMEEYANEPDEKVADVDSVIPVGQDLHSNQGDHRDDRQAGPLPVGRPMDEGLVAHLSNLYQEIKSRN